MISRSLLAVVLLSSCALADPPLTFNQESPSGVEDGSNNTFTLSAIPNPASSLALYRNGMLLKLGQDYDVSGSSVQFVSVEVPQSGDTLLATYVVSSSSTAVSVSLSPQAPIALIAGQAQPFTATVTGNSNTAVTWSISPSSAGTIDQSGNYTAPTPVSLSQDNVTVVATSKADITQSADAVVTLIPVNVSIETFNIGAGLGPQQQVSLSAAVTGSNNTAVTWSVSPGFGTINQSGVYTAPAAIAATTTAVVTAVSQADSTMSATAALQLIPISVTISPSAITLGPLGTQTFTTTVNATNNQSVTWGISPATGAGTVANGSYLAPAVITATSATITATSDADDTKSAAATITLTPSSGSGSGTCPPAGMNSWTGCYYSDQAFTVLVLSRNDPYNVLASGGESIPAGVNSVRWQLNGVFQGAEYDFYVCTDYTAAIFIDGAKVFDSTASTPISPNSYKFMLGLTNGSHTVEMDYVHGTGTTTASFGWGTN